MNKPIYPFYLDLSDDEIVELQSDYRDIIKSGKLILGPFTERFENNFRDYIGTKYAVAVSTGTSALEILCRIHHFEGKKVAVPTNTNFASVAAIIRANGIPVYLDMSKEYFQPTLEMVVNAHRIEGISAVMWVHIAGIIIPDFIEIVDYCKKNGLILIEDCAHAHGSQLNGIKAGAFADGGAFSFFPTKVMTTSEGGMITLNDEDGNHLARSFRNQGKRNQDYGNHHTDFGNSWRISEIAASMGFVQLRKLDKMIRTRQNAVDAIVPVLEKYQVKYCQTSHMDKASHYKFIILFNDLFSKERCIDSLKSKCIIVGGGVYETPCHFQPVFNNIPLPIGGLPAAEKYCPLHMCLPITSGLNNKDIEYMTHGLAEAFSSNAS
ncbi:MAG: DegT/DnrJ/EryC1/StrS family aminotransferase [Chthoniobacterales bacterium]